MDRCLSGGATCFAGAGTSSPRNWEGKCRTYPAADNTFNHVSFGSIITTKLRQVMVSGLGSVGVI